MSENMKNALDEDIIGDAYADLNKAEQQPILDFDEPIEVTMTDDMKKQIGGANSEENKTKIGTIALYIGIVLMIIAFVGLIQSVFTKKTVEFSQNGIKDVSDWNDFKENCSLNEKDSITVKIMDKDELESEKTLTFDGKTYSYGKKGKKYKYLIDKKDKVEDLGGSIRIIVLANEKYKFDELYTNMYYNSKTAKENPEIQEAQESVDNINMVLDNINDVEAGKDVAEVEKENEKRQKEKEEGTEEQPKIEYTMIYCY